MRFFTSDTHFGHNNILEYEAESRPFEDTSHMDEIIIANWNSVVGPDDTVFHLGDVALGKIADSLPKVARLNGFKVLIPGNHDRVFSGVKPGMAEKFLPEYWKVFDLILPEQFNGFMLEGNIPVNLCHFPYRGDHTTDERYPGHRPVDDGLPLIHGHVHSLWRTQGRQFNVGIDVHSLFPVPEEEIVEWARSLT